MQFPPGTIPHCQCQQGILDETVVFSIPLTSLDCGASDLLSGVLRGCRKELIGIILVKELILVDKEASTRVGELKMRSAPQLRADTRLYDMLRLFETGRCHMAVLVQPPAQSTPRPSTGGFTICLAACSGRVSTACSGRLTTAMTACSLHAAFWVVGRYHVCRLCSFSCCLQNPPRSQHWCVCLVACSGSVTVACSDSLPSSRSLPCEHCRLLWLQCRKAKQIASVANFGATLLTGMCRVRSMGP